MKSLVNKLKWSLLLVSATSNLSMAAPDARTTVATDHTAAAIEATTAAEAEVANASATTATAADATANEKANATATDKTLPAVSKVNVWVGAAADFLHNKHNSGAGGVVEGGIAAQVTPDFGFQLHTYDGFAGGATLVAVDGYVFWRNPERGLLGPHVLFSQLNNYNHTLYGLHWEGYFCNWTVVAEGGGAAINNGGGGAGYIEALVHWYPKPDWRVYAGVINLKGSGTGEIGTEYQLGVNLLRGLAIFADVGTGAHDLNYGFLGLRYYFNKIDCNQRSLIKRQREDMVLPTLDPLSV